jgi:hypothetical protein
VIDPDRNQSSILLPDMRHFFRTVIMAATKFNGRGLALIAVGGIIHGP